MKYNTKLHPNFLLEVNIKNDHSLAFADKIGFRAGTSKSFPYFDFMSRTVSSVQCQPLIFMENSCFASSNMNLSYGDSTFSRIENLYNMCEKHGGTFSFLWHNTELDSKIKKSFYRKMIMLDKKC